MGFVNLEIIFDTYEKVFILVLILITFLSVVEAKNEKEQDRKLIDKVALWQ